MDEMTERTEKRGQGDTWTRKNDKRTHRRQKKKEKKKSERERQVVYICITIEG